VNTDKTIAEILAETKAQIGVILAQTKDEVKEFVGTRLQLLKSELTEKMAALKLAIPLMLAAAVLVLTAWMAMTFALIALVHAWFLPSAYAWLWAGLIVGFVYLLGGALLGWLGYSEISTKGLTPTRTLNVLKQDQVWIQNEARAA
jgi:uncharacterized membrane protein YqjE